MGTWASRFGLIQFSLSLPDVEQHRESLRLWRTLSEAPAPRMCIDVRLRTSRLAPDQVVVGCAPNGHTTRVEELGDARTPSILLERWTVDMQYVLSN